MAGSLSRWRGHCTISRMVGKPGGGATSRSGINWAYNFAPIIGDVVTISIDAEFNQGS